MSAETKAFCGIAAYLLAAVVTFGHAHNWYVRHDLCDDKPFCVSPGELSVYSSLFWPFYWSMTAWRVEK